MRHVVRRAGQRFAIGFLGQSLAADAKALLREFGVGTVVLGRPNVAGPEQLAELVRELQAEARHAGHDQPLLMAVDRQGGRAAAFAEPWTLWPPARAVGRTGSEEISRRLGEAFAAELVACGIRLDLAPVVDVRTRSDSPVGEGSFGDDPDLVGRLGAAFVRGLQDGGVAACARHFPGQGDAEVDASLGLPLIDHGRGRLDEVELRPFRAAIGAGVSSVMAGNVVVSPLDPERPATLSGALVRLLREDLRFGGVVVSDDLESEGVARRWTAGERAVLAVTAGCDLVCFGLADETRGVDHGAQVEAIEALIRAMERDQVSFKEAEAAERRIVSLKERFLGGAQLPDPRQARLAAGALAHRLLADEIASRSGIPA